MREVQSSLSSRLFFQGKFQWVSKTVVGDPGEW